MDFDSLKGHRTGRHVPLHLFGYLMLLLFSFSSFIGRRSDGRLRRCARWDFGVLGVVTDTERDATGRSRRQCSGKILQPVTDEFERCARACVFFIFLRGLMPAITTLVILRFLLKTTTFSPVPVKWPSEFMCIFSHAMP